MQFFLKDNYLVLKAMVENEVFIKGHLSVPLSQDDIAQLTGFSKAKVNDIIKGLIEHEYVSFVSNGNYRLCSDAKEIYRYLENHK